ncbi:VOC family protein [Gottfriedia acidiceleris]|uniref:VOC family protein n=1 Tax=Gottfriedia acidiceleris TaxID=371036 RepID=UPI00101D66CF|nr:VOC family protein [Gottfriedia acidiceleris]
MKSTVSPIVNKVNYVFIHVKDLKKSVNWYCKLLGITFDSSQIKSPVFNIPVTGTTGLTLDDHTFDPNFKFEPSKNVLFNFYTEDIDAAYNFMKKNNITIVKEIERIGEFAYFNFEDLDGNVLMICTS